ncbi:MAG: LamG domain-containing protein [Sedimentisphaerales bacterium]|nr:LamG domain-containing protein [Sedimentisphaerales bacterium]
MNGKNVTLISCVILLSLQAAPAHAGPVGHWRFDEGSGLVVADSSGNNLQGALAGDVTWVDGNVGAGALSFGGTDGIVEIPDDPVLDIDGRLTIATWVNAHDFFSYYFLVCKSPSGSARDNFPGNFEFRLHINDGLLEFGHQTSEAEEYVFYLSSSPITAGKWHHIAVTLEEGGSVQFYIDGFPAGTVAQTTEFGILNDEPVRIGSRKDGYSFFNGQLDDVRIYDRVLTAGQMEGLPNGIEPAFPEAAMPQPGDGELLEQTYATLEWLAGDFAASHNVYFGTEAEAVANATETDADLFLGSTTDSSLDVGSAGSPHPDALVPGTTYYWRVDEINDDDPESPWKGAVWSFRVRPAAAWAPSPADGVSYAVVDPVLTWEPGLGALFHTVFFGETFDEINDAPPGTGFMTATPMHDPGLLEQDKTYYWRVDEFAATGQPKGQVWSFTTTPAIAVGDESLLGWWTFDEADAGSAVDWSGHDLHGAIMGEPQPVGGAVDGAVQLDGADDYFSTSAPVGVETNTATMTAWVKPEKKHTSDTGILLQRAVANNLTFGMNLLATNQLAYIWSVPESWSFQSGLVLPTNEWSFVAVVVEPDQATLYLDGTDVFVSNVFEHPSIEFTSGITLGNDPVVAGRCFGGTLDDVRLYTKALSTEELEAVMAAGTKPPATVDPMMIESFDSYNAYSVDYGVNVWDVWTEGYSGNGTGSALGHATAPYLERVVTVGGGQALPLYYDNSGNFRDMNGDLVPAKYSEISRTFSPAEDLTRDGATALVLWMRGVAANTAEAADALYVVLEDGTQSDVVPLAQPEDLTWAIWQKLRIPLDGLTVDVTAVTKITIGIGDKNSAVPGGAGFVYIDDVALEAE